MTAAPRSSLAGLHVLADDDPRWKWDPVEQARAACEGGAAVVQLRAKRTGDREALAWGREIRGLTRACGALFFVNDRFDLARLCEADGVHLGQTDLPPARLPAEARARLAVGRSTHDEAEVRRALAEERLELHGWVYDLAGLQIRYYDADEGHFVTFTPSTSQAAP